MWRLLVYSKKRKDQVHFGKKLLCNKRVENTMNFIGMINFKDDEFEVATETTADEAKQILSVGYDHITEKRGTCFSEGSKGSQM